MSKRNLGQELVDVTGELHHWNKYHNPTPSGFMGGQFYLGVDCASCRFGEVERAVRKMIEVKILRDLANEIMLNELANIIAAKADRLEAEVSRGGAHKNNSDR